MGSEICYYFNVLREIDLLLLDVYPILWRKLKSMFFEVISRRFTNTYFSLCMLQA